MHQRSEARSVLRAKTQRISFELPELKINISDRYIKYRFPHASDIKKLFIVTKKSSLTLRLCDFARNPFLFSSTPTSDESHNGDIANNPAKSGHDQNTNSQEHTKAQKYPHP